MADFTSTVSIGETTKKSHFDQLLSCSVYLASATATLNGEKTFKDDIHFSSDIDIAGNMSCSTATVSNDITIVGNSSCDIMTFNGFLLTNPVSGSQSVGASSSWTPSIGLYQFVTNDTAADLGLQINIGGNWYGDFNFAGLTFCDGVNMRIENRNGTTAYTIYYYKYT